MPYLTYKSDLPHSQVLDVPPGEFGVCLEAEGDDAGGERRGGAGAGVRGGAEVVQVGGDHLALGRRPRAVGARQGGRTRLGIPEDSGKFTPKELEIRKHTAKIELISGF